MSKKLLGLIAGLAVALSVMVVPVVHGEDAINLDDMSNEQLIAYIQALLQGGSTVTTPTNDTTPTTGSSNWVSLGIPAGFQFSKNLSQGMTGNDVKYLQIVLNSDPATAVATTGVGSKGNESSYFGGLSKAAVVKFQEKYASSVLTPLGLTNGTGFVGTTTRAKLNELLAKGTTGSVDVSGLTAVECVTQGYAWNGTVCSDPKAGQIDVSSLSALDCVTKGYAWNGTKCYDPKGGDTTAPVVTPVTGAGLVVALSSDSPANSTLITGQSAAPLAKFVITNKDSVEAKVTKVELQRIGVSGDTTLANVYLFDGITRLTDAATISQGKITFNNPYGVVTIPAGNSVIVTVASDIATGTAGQTAGVALIGLTSNVEVKSTLPITGGTQTIASADLAEVTVDTVSNPSGSVSVNAGATGYTVFQAPITVTKREVELKGATFKVIGSIPTDALENIKLYYNGILVSDAVTLASDSTARFVLSTPKKIQSGNLEVRADVVKGSSRNFSFSLQNASDLVVVDSVYNVNAVVKGTPKTAGTVTISQGSVSITQDSTFNKTSVTGGVSNITLAKFNFKAYGEDVKISQLGVKPTLTGVDDTKGAGGNAITTIDNVTIYANGAPITTNKNIASGNTETFNLGSSLVIPANTVVSIEIKGDTKGSTTTLSNVNMAEGSIQMDLVAGSNNAQGVSSMQLTSTAAISGQNLTVGSGTLTLVSNPSVAAGKITQNTANQRIGSFVVQAGDSEGVRIGNISVELATAGMTTNQLSNLYVKYAGEESDKITPQTTNNFSVSKELAANESMIIDVYVDVSTAASGQTVAAELGVSTYGLSSNISITPAAATGKTMTVAVPSLATPTLTSDSLAAQFVLGGKKIGEVAKFNFVATDGEVTLDKVSFEVTDTTGTVNDTITSITVAGKTGYVVGSKVTISGLGFTIPAGNAGKSLPVEVTYNNVGKTITEAPIVSNTVSRLTLTGFEYLAGNARTPVTSLTVSAKDMNVVSAIPSVTLNQDNRTGLINGEVKLADITVSTAQEGGAILIEQLPIKVTSTGTVDIAAAAAVVVRDDAGRNIALKSGTSLLAITAGSFGTTNIEFDGGYRIESGSSKTFSVYATVANVGTDNALTTNLGAKGSFEFTDVNSNIANITGEPTYTYSSNSSTIKN